MSKLKEKQKEREIVEQIFSDIVDDIIPPTDVNAEFNNDRIGPLNYFALKEKCTNEAKELIDSMISFYLPSNMMEVSYIKSRIKDDILTISDLLFNMKTSEHAIMKLLETIDEGGNYNAKNFEQLSKLQTSKMEIVKHYEALKTILENNYKSLKRDYGELFAEVEDNSLEGYGHKGLLAKLKNDFINELDESNVIETEFDLVENESIEELELPPGVKLYTGK